MRIAFMGTAEFGIPTLRTLAVHHEIAGVVTRPDAAKGRGRLLQPPPVKTAAQELDIPVLQPERLNGPAFIDALQDWRAELFVVVAFRILPPAVFNIPPRGTVNLHASLLPDYRGAAPINRAIINGDTETGVTTFFIDEAVDTGDIILSSACGIGPDETAGELYDRLKAFGAGVVLDTVNLIETGNAPRKHQDLTTGRPAPKLFRDDGRIDWTKSAREVHNLVRGVNPAPGAFTDWDRGPFKIHRTAVTDETMHGDPGRIVSASPSDGVEIACGRGRVKLLEVQPPCKRAMDGAAFVRGYNPVPGEPIFVPAGERAGAGGRCI